MKRRHHFVPQFYLRAFASEPKRIHVANVARKVCIKSASLRDQCHSHRLYGATDDLEDALGALEAAAAPILRQVARDAALPHCKSLEHRYLAQAVALQLLRTTRARDEAYRMLSGLTCAAFDGLVPPQYAVDEKEALRSSLAALEDLTQAIASLRCNIVCAPDGWAFFTSDNPVFRYNQYCEGVTWVGVLGARSPGIQIGMPVSPGTLLIYADQRVYKFRSQGAQELTRATGADMEALNRLQVLGAEHNVYFSRWEDRVFVERQLARERVPLRTTQVTIADEVADEASSLIHGFERMTTLRLSLSFLSVRRNARRVPLCDRPRIGRVRNGHDLTGGASPTSRLRSFKVRKDRD